MPATIFVTAYDQYALQAFDSAAVDYLVKPFKDDRFEEALRRARRRIESESRERLHERLIALLQGGSSSMLEPSEIPDAPAKPREKYLERIAVQMRGKMRVVPVAQIDYVTASGQYVELHVGTHRYIIRESMQHLEERLDPEHFVRVHRSAIVRLSLVDTLLRSEGSDYQVQLKGGVRLPVGDRAARRWSGDWDGPGRRSLRGALSPHHSMPAMSRSLHRRVVRAWPTVRSAVRF